MEAKSCKKASDQSKIKSKSAKKVKSTETLVTVIPEVKNSLQIPDLNALRQDALIQLKIEQRLREIQDADKVKLNLCVADPLRSWLRIRLSGRMSTYCLVRVKRESHTTSCRWSSGWLAFVAS